MGFLYPYNLFFLPLAFLPLIIHLIKQKRVRQEPFPDIRLIERAKVDLRRRIILKELIKLFMRMMTIALLVLTLSGMYFGRGRINKLLVIIDNSPSMGLKVGNERLFDRAKDVVSEIVKNAPSNTEVSIHGLIGDFGCNYTFDRARLNNIIKNMPYGFNSPDIKIKLDGLLKKDEGRTKVLFITDGFYVKGMDNLKRFDVDIDVIPLITNERVENLRIEKRELLNGTPYTLLSLSGLESHNNDKIEVVEGEKRRTEKIENEGESFNKRVKTDFDAGYMHLINSNNTFGSYAFFGEMPKVSISISTDNAYYNKVISASVNALKSRFPILVNNSKSPGLNIVASDSEKIDTNYDNILLFVENGFNTDNVSVDVKSKREINYEHWQVINPLQWVWNSKVVSFDMSDIRFSKLVFSDSIYDRVILVSEDGKPVLSVKDNRGRRIYFCSIPLSSEFSDLVIGGGIVKIIAIVINDIADMSECDTNSCEEGLKFISSPFSLRSYIGLLPGIYKRSDGKVVGVNVWVGEFNKLNIDILKSQLTSRNINFVYNIVDYLNTIRSTYFDLRPPLLTLVFILLLLDTVIFYPAFRHLAAGAIL